MMKKIFLFLLITAGLTTTQVSNAKIWRVNNNPGKNCNFTTLTAALQSSAVMVNDTIHIEGSVTEYGKNQTATNCDTIRKKLVILGPGYLLSDNPETQHNKESAKIRTLHILPAAAGTIIAGIEQASPGAVFNNTTYTLSPAYNTNIVYSENRETHAWGAQPRAYKIRIEADNVTITHCKLFYVDLYNVNYELKNITITKCTFNPGIISCRAGLKTVSNLVISNNYFRNDGAPNYSLNYHVSQLDYNGVIDLKGFASTSLSSPGVPAVYDLYPWPVITPTIQNNTFYRGFNIQARRANIFNNLFFCNWHGASGYMLYGLPVWDIYTNTTRNNIVYSGTGSPWPTPSTTYNYGGMESGTNGNQYNNSNEVSWFVASTTAPNLDKSFVLGSNSPAKGSDGAATTQRGMFGGLSPYVLSGLYTVPAVWSMAIPDHPTGEVPSTGFELNVQVKSH